MHNLWLVYRGNGLAFCVCGGQVFKWLEWFKHEHSNDGNDVDTVLIPILWITPFFFFPWSFLFLFFKEGSLLITPLILMRQCGAVGRAPYELKSQLES